MSTPILATKLYIPSARPGFVFRTSLVERLNEGLLRKMTLISAPAGFGKTTLLSEWIPKSPRCVTWLSLDKEDHEPTRFWTYFISSLQGLRSDLGKTALALLQSRLAPSITSILTTLINDITTFPDLFAAVLDDYHVVDSQPIDQALTFLIEHLPPNMHLVIATRQDPNLPLARLRARDQLNELRIPDLRFSPSEAAEFLNQVMGLSLSSEDITLLENRTEGWIAGLQLAAISMRGQKVPTSFIRSFTGSNHFIMDYLVEEILQQQSEHIQNFLLRTSIFNRLCGPLCDAVLLDSSNSGQETLEYLEQANLFIVPLDNERRWYRYHHLFAEVLQAHLMKKQSNHVPTLHQRASVWYEQDGSPSDAICHALAAKDFERAAGLIELTWPEMDQTFQSNIWLEWAKALPDDLVRARPVLSVDYAWAFLNGGEMDAAKSRLRDAEQWLETTAEPSEQEETSSAKTGLERSRRMVVVDKDQFRSLPASISTAYAYEALALGDVPSTVIFARQALDLLPDDDHLRRGPAASILGLAYWASGDLEEAHQALADAMAGFQMSDNIIFAISGTYGLADIRIAQGRLREAISIYERTLQLAIAQGEPAIPGTADLYLGLSKLYRERGDVEAAEQNLTKSVALGERAALADWPYRLRIAQSRIKQSQGDLDGAIALLDEAQRLFFSSPVPETRPITAMKTQVWVAQGRLTDSLAWVQERGLSVDSDLSYLREFELITLARILLAQYKNDREDASLHKAIRLIERLLKSAQEGQRAGSVIEIQILQALAYEAQGDIPLALESLKCALALAEPEGYIGIFIDEGTSMARLLYKALAHGIEPTYVRRLLVAFPVADSEPADLSLPPDAEAGLIEPLSMRELEVLQVIAEGLSNQEVANRLYLSLHTVKVHARNIYAKLGAKNRTQAVAKGRTLGILSQT